MPKHSKEKTEMPVMEESAVVEKPKRKSAMRKLEDKEKFILKKHMDEHMKEATKSDKARARMKLMRTKVPIKSMTGLHKLLG